MKEGSSDLFEHILSNTTDGALPIARQIIERCARINACILIAFLWIIYVTTRNASPLVHDISSWNLTVRMVIYQWIDILFDGSGKFFGDLLERISQIFFIGIR
jgi:hypothetical protein